MELRGDKMTWTNKPTGRVALLGILSALAILLSWLEGLLPALPIPGAKLGLSNLATMTALSALSVPAGFGVTLAKAGFALFRGGTACIMSLAGGLLSTLTMALLWRISRDKPGWLGLGMAGAVTHNMGQLLAAMWLADLALWRMAPLLLLMALVAGCVTGLTMYLLLPRLNKVLR